AVEAAVFATDPVRDHVGTGRDAGDLAALDAEDRRGYVAVAGCGARGVRAVSDVVARRGERANGHRALASADAGVVRGHEAVRADQLVVAGERPPPVG